LYHITSFGSNGLGSAVWLLTAYLLGMGLNRTEIARTSFRAGIVALGLLLAGHFMVFVSMADELSRLIASSLDRLLLQIWPSALLIFFMGVRTMEEALSKKILLEQPAESGSGALR
jgi:O-antigen ligase